MGVKKKIARVVEVVAKECVERRMEKSSSFWMYEEPVPEEVKKWLEEKNA